MMQIFVCVTMPYGKSGKDNLNEPSVLSDQLRRGSWKNSRFVWYFDDKSDNKDSVTHVFHQSVVKWLTKEFLFAKSDLCSKENKKQKVFSKKFYRPENCANTVGLKVGIGRNL